MTEEGIKSVELLEGNSWVLPTDIDLKVPAQEAFVRKLVEAGWDPDSRDVYWFTYAFDEAYINAVAHGNLGMDKPEGPDGFTMKEIRDRQASFSPAQNRKIYVDIDISETEASLTIRDDGDGFDPSEVPDPTLEENRNKSNGRGIATISKLFDSVKYSDGGRCITIKKTRTLESVS